MTGVKNGKFLEFHLDDGKMVKYDLSTGQSIGVKGKPVKSTNHKFRNMSISTIINSIDSDAYKKFLFFVKERNPYVCSFGTLLSRASEYSKHEQVFSSGVKVGDLRYASNASPNIIKFCKKFDIPISDFTCINYNKNPDFYNLLFSLNTNISKDEKYSIINSTYYSDMILNQIKLGYNPKSLILYMDEIITYEALSLNNFLTNFKDYVYMMSRISPKKFDKYPRNLLTTHAIAVRNYNRFREEYNESLFKSKIKEWMEFSYKDYTILYPKCTQDIKDEACQQHNCVASYIDSVIDGRCDIVFLRKKDNPDKSLVTVEVRNGKVVQSKGKHNSTPREDELYVLKKYEEYLTKQMEK